MFNEKMFLGNLFKEAECRTETIKNFVRSKIVLKKFLNVDEEEVELPVIENLSSVEVPELKTDAANTILLAIEILFSRAREEMDIKATFDKTTIFKQYESIDDSISDIIERCGGGEVDLVMNSLYILQGSIFAFAFNFLVVKKNT